MLKVNHCAFLRHTFAVFIGLLSVLLLGRMASAQVPVISTTNNGSSAGGVYMDAEGMVRFRELDTKQLDIARTRAHNALNNKDEKLVYVSLPKLCAEAKAAVTAGKEIPQEVRLMHGLLQVDYVFVYPDAKDLIIAGPAEAPDITNQFAPVGQRTGRPIMQLDDLVVAMRTAAQFGGRTAFGCTIDLAPDSLQQSEKVMHDLAGAPRAQRMAAMQKALGPQHVAVFGTVADTHLAFICVAADYKLKRLCLGIDETPVANLGNPVDTSRSAANRYWFELAYDPMLVSPDGNAFQFRGQRLQLKAGGQSFDPRGATDKAVVWAKSFTAKMPQLANNVPLFADLEDIADLSMLATLIRHDKLNEHAGWDMAWIMDESGYPVSKVHVAQTAETLVNYTNGSLCAGGVMFTTAAMIDVANRQTDENNTLAPVKDQAQKLKDVGNPAAANK